MSSEYELCKWSDTDAVFSWTMEFRRCIRLWIMSRWFHLYGQFESWILLFGVRTNSQRCCDRLHKLSCWKALLDHIKHVAVGSTHKDYERWKFNQICQQEGEPVTKFVARLKAQALLCDFNIHVSAGNTKVAHSYAEDMISQRLTSGVINPEHREKLLSEAPNMKSLKEKVDKLMSLEATEQVSSKFQMSSPTISAPGRSPSQFKRFKNQSRFTAG